MTWPARAEEMALYNKFKAYEKVTDETCVSRLDANQSLVDGETSTKLTMNVWQYEAEWSHVKSNRKGLTATSQEHHRKHSYVS